MPGTLSFFTLFALGLGVALWFVVAAMFPTLRNLVRGPGTAAPIV